MNEIIIAPACRITITSHDGSLAISSNDHYDIEKANNLVYAIPHKDAIDRKKGIQIDIQKLPETLQEHLNKSGKKFCNYFYY